MKLTQIVIACAIEVQNTLGCGFLEAVYENALARELSYRGISFKRQMKFDILYKETVIGRYAADLVVHEKLLVELKAAKQLTRRCEAQVINYLHASGLNVGLLFNFGARSLQIRRLINGTGPEIDF